MTQLRHIRRLVRSRLGVPMQDQMFTDDQLDDHINLAVETIEAEQRWPWQEHVERVDVTLNDPDIVLDDCWRATRGVYLDDTELTLVSPTDILAFNVNETPAHNTVHQQAVPYGFGLWGDKIYGQEDTVGIDVPRSAAITGRPEVWAPVGNLIMVRPWPSGPMTLTHYFYTSPVWLRDDDDRPAMPDQFIGAIVAKAAELLSVREDDRAAAMGHNAEYSEWIERMRRDVRRSTTPVRIRVRAGESGSSELWLRSNDSWRSSRLMKPRAAGNGLAFGTATVTGASGTARARHDLRTVLPTSCSADPFLTDWTSTISAGTGRASTRTILSPLPAARTSSAATTPRRSDRRRGSTRPRVTANTVIHSMRRTLATGGVIGLVGPAKRPVESLLVIASTNASTSLSGASGRRRRRVASDFVARFADFTGGDHGVRDPAYADVNQWSGENLVIYPSGLLGPRAGIKVLHTSGIPDYTTVPGPWGFAAFNNALLIVSGNRVYRVPMDGGPATAWAPYPATVDSQVRFVQANRTVYSLFDGVVYKHDGVTSTTAITTPEPLSDIVRWGYWLVGVSRSVPWRIWFTKLSAGGVVDFDVWPVNNYYDVGNNDPITCLQPIYNTLYAGKREGWWAISGVLGQLASIRDVVVGNGPTDPRFTNLTTDNRVIYWPVDNTPAWFNGDRVTLVPEQEMFPRFLPYTGEAVIVTPTARRIVLAGDSGGEDPDTRLYAYQDGVWTHHRSPFRLGAFAPGDARTGSDLPNNVIYAAQRPTTIGDPVVIVSIQHEISRPAHHDDQYASPTDGPDAPPLDLITGHVSLPAWYDTQGRLSRVRWVQVQFRKWQSGVNNTMNRLALHVEALGPYGGGSENSEQAHWIEPSERAPRFGGDDSWRTNLGEQGWANGFRIHFDQVAGVALREVVVGVNLRTERQ